MNLKTHKIIGILRNMPYENLKQIIATASSYNIKAFEISIMNEESYNQIRYLKSCFPDLIIGAGTVTDNTILDRAITAGADFILSPSCDESILSECLNKGINLVPGVFTPSDVNLARRYGFKYLKLFPSDSLPLGYIKALKAPFPDTDYMAVGGVNPMNIHDYLNNGFTAVGIGSSLFSTKLSTYAQEELNNHFSSILL